MYMSLPNVINIIKSIQCTQCSDTLMISNSSYENHQGSFCVINIFHLLKHNEMVNYRPEIICKKSKNYSECYILACVHLHMYMYINEFNTCNYNTKWCNWQWIHNRDLNTSWFTLTAICWSIDTNNIQYYIWL